MNAEQRVWLASILSAVILVGYAQVLSRNVKQPPAAPQETVLPAAPEPPPQETIARLLPSEERITLESPHLLVEIGRQSAAIKRIVLKEFQNLQTQESLQFISSAPLLLITANAGSEGWVLTRRTPQRAVWESTAEAMDVALTMALDQGSSTIAIELSAKSLSGSQTRLPITVDASWVRGDEVVGRYNLLEMVLLTKKTLPWQRTHLTYHEGAKQPRIVPRATSLATLSERFFCQSIRLPDNHQAAAAVLPGEPGSVSVRLSDELEVEQAKRAAYALSLYVGPRDFFLMRDVGFSEAFPRGLLAKIGLVLLVFLKGIASVVRNYGLAIILLAGLVTAVLAPFTLISFRSMKKMQELQPRLDQLKKKYPNDPQRVNREMMALFKEHRVSPLSGCLPMLLQLPVFFALWSAISHVIELRGERLLWIKDLSLPDRLARLPWGLELNLLPILMAIAMYVQTKMSQAKVTRTDSPLAGVFSGPLMSVMFGFMFYQVPSGLVLYWLTNSLTSIVWYRLAKL
ncbi:MAG: membrane protein insertase YidC [Candidatus Omnitrophica bacterium]|nr:membrane protein insertase YidC [Candidatus Omnitrophota bacterium]